jgi:hypothetical protein
MLMKLEQTPSSRYPRWLRAVVFLCLIAIIGLLLNLAIDTLQHLLRRR